MILSLPLYLLFIPYGVFLLFFAFYAIFNLFQLYKHGVRSVKTQVLGLVFMGTVAGILVLTFVAGGMVDWTSALIIDMSSPA